MRTPIAVVIFNRPDHARSLRKSLHEQQDRDLYVIVDGARPEKLGEQALIDESIAAFDNWNGKINFNIADHNLGCKNRVTSGLNWVFDNTERAIILEDDLSPSPQFFEFCDVMLDEYENNQEVMSVCGTKRYLNDVHDEQFFFTKYHNCWGWATWKRSWALFDEQFNDYSKWKMFTSLKRYLGSSRAALYWIFRLRQVLSGKKSSWAYCWMITCFMNKGLHIVPSQNLVINTGFGENSTHTTTIEPYMPSSFGASLSFPIQVDKKPQSNKNADRWVEDHIFSKSLKNRVLWLFNKNTFSKLLKGRKI